MFPDLSAVAPTTFNLAVAALICGALALLLSLYFVASYASDIARLTRPDSSYRGRGPLRGAIAPFLNAEGRVVSSLSPDAAWAAIRTAAEANLESRQSVIRFFTYAPLLLGLAGTLLGLSHLIPSMAGAAQGVAQGKALDALQTVFVGTISGVVGSLIGSLAGVIVSTAGPSAVRKLDEFVQRQILPCIPEHRISVDIEEAVLSSLTSRTQAAVDRFAAAIQPIADSLRNSAQQSALAGTEATNAFGEARQALKSAGSLSRAAQTLLRGLDEIQRTAATAGQIVGQAREISEHSVEATLRIASAAAEANSAAGTLRAASDALAGSSNELRESTDRSSTFVKEAIGALIPQISSISGSFDGLAAHVRQLNANNEERAGLWRADSVAAEQAVRSVRQNAEAFVTELAGVRGALETFASKTGESIKTASLQSVKELATAFGERLAQLRTEMDSASAVLRESAKTVRTQLTAAPPELREIVERISALSQLITRDIALLEELKLRGGSLQPPVVTQPRPADLSTVDLSPLRQDLSEVITRLDRLVAVTNDGHRTVRARLVRLFKRA